MFRGLRYHPFAAVLAAPALAASDACTRREPRHAFRLWHPPGAQPTMAHHVHGARAVGDGNTDLYVMFANMGKALPRNAHMAGGFSPGITSLLGAHWHRLYLESKRLASLAAHINNVPSVTTLCMQLAGACGWAVDFALRKSDEYKLAQPTAGSGSAHVGRVRLGLGSPCYAGCVSRYGRSINWKVFSDTCSFSTCIQGRATSLARVARTILSRLITFIAVLSHCRAQRNYLFLLFLLYLQVSPLDRVCPPVCECALARIQHLVKYAKMLV
jgi:hypothetical protein